MPINLFEKEPPGDAVKVLSYNTMAFEQGHPNLKDNPNSVLEYLRNSNADIYLFARIYIEQSAG